jgi:hypothetical protein
MAFRFHPGELCGNGGTVLLKKVKWGVATQGALRPMGIVKTHAEYLSFALWLCAHARMDA